jgi:hypothetical protein
VSVFVHLYHYMRQFRYFCTRKYLCAEIVPHTHQDVCRAGELRRERQYLYFCTSKASKASKASVFLLLY